MIYLWFLLSDFNQGSFPRAQPGRSNSPFYPSQIQNFIPNPVSAFTPPSPRSGPAAVQVPQVGCQYFCTDRNISISAPVTTTGINA